MDENASVMTTTAVAAENMDETPPKRVRFADSNDYNTATISNKLTCDRCCKSVDARLVTDICIDCRLELWNKSEPYRSRRRLRHVTLGGVPDIGASSYLSAALQLIVYTAMLRNIVFASARLETRAVLPLQPYTFPDSIHARDLAVRLAWTPLVLRLALIDRRQQESALVEEDLQSVRDEALINSVNPIDGHEMPLELLLRVSQNDVFACRRALAERAWHGYHDTFVENQQWTNEEEETIVEIDLFQLTPSRHPLSALLHVMQAYIGFDQVMAKIKCFGVKAEPMSLRQSLLEV